MYKTKPISRQQQLFHILALGLILALVAGMALPQPALATAPGPGVEVVGEEINSIQSGQGTSAVCGTHNWVYPTGDQITVKGFLGGSAKSSLTPASQLTLDGGQVVYAFCTDINHTVGSNERYCLDSSFFSDWRVTWLVTNYPPTLTSNTDHSARQAAVWHLTDGFDLNQDDPTTSGSTIDNAVKNHYNAILAAIPANQPPEYTPGNVQLVIDPASDTNFVPGQEVHHFTVRLTKGGQPLPGYTVNVTATFGSLNQNSAVTDSNGEAPFTLTSAAAGTAQISASALVELPAGSRFVHETDPLGKQRLVLGDTQDVPVNAQAEKTWVSAENVIIAHKFEDRNFNQVQDAGEPDLANWEFTLTVPGGSQFVANTDSQGKAYFYDKIVENGTFTLTETKPADWTNSTPLSQSKERTEGNEWNQWAADFGNAQYSVITVVKYEDLNGDGEWLEGTEPKLPGWQFALYYKDNGLWKQLTGGSTGANGSISFTDLPAGEYKVVEQTQPDYTNTTLLEQEVLLGYPEHHFMYFGNQRFFMDYGDLPEGGPYFYDMTTFANNGARHQPQDGNVILGTLFDAEYEGQPHPNSLGDDASSSDEDGVDHKAGGSWGNGVGTVSVTISVWPGSGGGSDESAGCLMGWLDFYDAASSTLESDGIFQESFTYNAQSYSEKIINNQYVTPGVHPFTFALPEGAAAGVGYYARFRLVPYDGSGYNEETGQCNQAAVGLKGLAYGGEVEDYFWLFGPTAVTLQGFSADMASDVSITTLLILALSLGVLTILWRILRKAQG